MINTKANERTVPIILLCCSRDIDPQDQEQHYSWEYIKGAGDDEENWARGLTPSVFWAHIDDILSPVIDSNGTEEVVDRLVSQVCHREQETPNSSIKVGKMNFFFCSYDSFFQKRNPSTSVLITTLLTTNTYCYITPIWVRGKWS